MDKDKLNIELESEDVIEETKTDLDMEDLSPEEKADRELFRRLYEIDTRIAETFLRQNVEREEEYQRSNRYIGIEDDSEINPVEYIERAQRRIGELNNTAKKEVTDEGSTQEASKDAEVADLEAKSKEMSEREKIISGGIDIRGIIARASEVAQGKIEGTITKAKPVNKAKGVEDKPKIGASKEDSIIERSKDEGKPKESSMIERREDKGEQKEVSIIEPSKDDKKTESKAEIKLTVNEDFMAKFIAAKAGITTEQPKKLGIKARLSGYINELLGKEKEGTSEMPEENKSSENLIDEYKSEIDDKNNQTKNSDNNNGTKILIPTRKRQLEEPTTTKPTIKETEEFIAIKSEENEYKKVTVLKGKILDKIKENMQNKTVISKRKLAIAGAIGFCMIAITGLGINLINSSEPEIRGYASENEVSLDGDELIIKSFDYIEKDDESESSKEENANKASLESTNNMKEIRAKEDTNKREESKEDKADDKKEEEKEDTSREEDSKEEINADRNESESFLETIKVGSEIDIEAGRYFETPEGTGDYGHFENHQGTTKTVEKIGIATTDGYVSVLEDEIKIRTQDGEITMGNDELSVAKLQVMFPDGEYSYHIVEEKDEKEYILGWLTEESFEQELEQDNAEIFEKEER